MEESLHLLRILILSGAELPSRTANSVQTVKMSEAMAQEGNRVMLFGYAGAKVGIKQTDLERYYGTRTLGTVYLVQRPKIFVKIQLCLRYLKLLKSFSPDLVYTRSILAAFVSLIYKKNIILEFHKPEDDSFLKALLLRRLVRSKSRIRFVTISRSLSSYYLDRYPTMIGSLIVAPDGASVDNAETESTFRKTVGSGQGFTVGYFGHLYKGRGMGLIVKLALALPEITFDLYGGSEEDIEYWRRKTAEVANVRVLGFIQPSLVSEKRAKCDVLLAPYEKQVKVAGGEVTTQWMSPLKVFEYMSSKRPMLCSDLPVLREILEHRRNAILCDIENLDDWINGILELKENAKLSEYIANEAFSDVSTLYSWRARSDKVLEEFPP